MTGTGVGPGGADREAAAITAALSAAGTPERARAALLGPGDVPLIGRMLRESRTWALADGLASDVMGGLAERAGASYPQNPRETHPSLGPGESQPAPEAFASRTGSA